MTDKYHFEKPTIKPHVLQDQLDGLLELLALRDKQWKESFAETEKLLDEATAFDELVEARKAEIKRDKPPQEKP